MTTKLTNSELTTAQAIIDREPAPLPLTASQLLEKMHDYEDPDPDEFLKSLNKSLANKQYEKNNGKVLQQRKQAAALLTEKVNKFANYTPNISPKDVERTKEIIRLAVQPTIWKKIKRLWTRFLNSLLPDDQSENRWSK